MAAKTHSGLVNVVVLAIVIILGGFSLIIYAAYPPGIMRDFVVVLGIGLAVVLAGYIFFVKTIFLSGGKR
ncbi:MAG: hypothetical protein ACFFD4_25560 [Candidatus Odinarchaeota archaeon]